MKYEILSELMRSRLTYFLLLVIGLLGAGYFVYEAQFMRRIASSYKETTCVIESSEVVVTGRRKGGAPTSFAPQFTYAYTVAGKTYHGNVFRRGQQGMSLDEAEEVADTYRRGTRASCFYDPENPVQAVLIRESDERWLQYVFVGSIGLMAVGLLGWIILECLGKPAAPKRGPADPSDQPLEIPAWSDLSRLNRPGVSDPR